MFPASSYEARIQRQLHQAIKRSITKIPSTITTKGATPSVGIEGYARWYLQSVVPVSKHSCIYCLRSDDEGRGTPILKGRRTVWSRTWHTTLLAQVGSNKEGPLPWIERDYTPISTAQDWENGRVDLLVKVYPSGAATSWLHRSSSTPDCYAEEEEGKEGDGSGADGSQKKKQKLKTSLQVWLSQPKRTMSIPSLTLPGASIEQINRNPTAGVLLLLAGTGIVSAAQVLHHTDKKTCFGKVPKLSSPIRLIYCCRSDDVLMIPDIVEWCRKHKLEHCHVVMSGPNQSSMPFPEGACSNVDEAFKSVDNANFTRGRVSLQLLRKELSCLDHSLEQPRRIVVSGPEGFNQAVRQMLKESGVFLDDEVTFLEA